jgi:hypothetical protein
MRLVLAAYGGSAGVEVACAGGPAGRRMTRGALSDS